MGIVGNINVSILQMEKSSLGELTAKTFWSGPSQMYRAVEDDVGDLDVKSRSLLIY